MIVMGIILGIAIMGAMVFLIFDKKSAPTVRVASLIALGIMVLTVIICIFIIFTDDRVAVDPSVLIVGAPVETKKESDSNIWIILLLILILAGLFAVVAIHTIRENRKNKPKLSNIDSGTSTNFDF
jgi:formate hydrogenlyase subunit 3/multisubunit Na+/H+ antiporter MnhD subunit